MDLMSGKHAQIVEETMAEKKIVWKSDDGKEYESEIDALRADAAYWKIRALNKPEVKKHPGGILRV